MKKHTLIFFILGLNFIYSCRSREDKAKAVVNEFLIEINDQTKTLNKDLMTDSFAEFFKAKSYYLLQNWELTVKPQDDSTFIIEAKGHTYNGLGQPVENLQELYLTNRYGTWKIFDSYNLVDEDLDFEIVDTQWDFYSDRMKDKILKQLQDRLKLEILVPGYSDFWGDLSGKLKLINNSDYDIKDITILIEHFDNQGNSVNTDHTYIDDIVRKHGYREFDWYTTNCSQCVRQEFKINFIKESE